MKKIKIAKVRISRNITPEGGCTTTGVSLGSLNSFQESVTDSIALTSAGASADTSCYWDFTGIGITQTIPEEQPVGSYSIDMTLTATAY
ncbi:hypothetical protein ACFL1U_03415 [Patescibacteria group bacterium]